MDRDLNLVNLTGHRLDLIGASRTLRLESKGRARVKSRMKMETRAIGPSSVSIPVLVIHEQEIVQLPAPRDNTLYIVSGLVAAVAADQGRVDVVAPSRVERVNGQVIGARALVRIDRGNVGG